MKTKLIIFATLAAALAYWVLPSRGFEYTVSQEELREARQKLIPLHETIGKPQLGDWLTQHKERGQTFEQYLKCGPIMPWGIRDTIYIQPIGTFSPERQKILDETLAFMRIFFGREVITQPPIALEHIPEKARRVHPDWGDQQILTTYVLNDILKPTLPEDGAVGLAFTASDLWPGKGWNFVFGQASTRSRVGVWSIYRNGDPAVNETAYKLCLRRTIKTAIHETAHMFTLLHCTLYECGMCGSNNRGESDRRPLTFCPECDMKVCWATQQEPIARYQKLVEICRELGLEEEAVMYEKSIEVLKLNAKSDASTL